MARIPSESTSGYEEVGFSLAASAIGGMIVVPMFMYQALPTTMILGSQIITGINVSARILGLTAMAYMVIRIKLGRIDWIQSTNHSLVRKIRLGFLLVFCILRCVTSITQCLLLTYCLEKMPKEKDTVVLVETLTVLPYIFFQVGFISYSGRYTFRNVRTVKCVTFIIALSNIIDGTTTVAHHISVPPSANIVKAYNCSFVSHISGRQFAFVVTVFKTPVYLEFSILATILILALRDGNSWNWGMISYRNSSSSSHDLYYYRLKDIFVKSSVVLSIFLSVATVIQTSYLVACPENIYAEEISKYTIFSQKILVFVHILIIHHHLFRKLPLCVEYTAVNFSDLALMLSAGAVLAFVTVVYFFHPFGIMTLVTLVNIFDIFYQTNFLLYGRRIATISTDEFSSSLLKGSFLVLLCSNITSWFADSFFGLLDIAEALTNTSLVHGGILLYLVYPFLPYFRFQSSMELIEFYRNI